MTRHGFRPAPVRSPLLRGYFLFLGVREMFQFPRCPPQETCGSRTRRLGCPIRKSRDQRSLATPPRVSSQCHVLHRHAAPRHPPVAHTVFPGGTLDAERNCVPITHQFQMHIGKVHRQDRGPSRILLSPQHWQGPSPLNRDDDHVCWSTLLGYGWLLMQLPRKEVIQPHLPVRLPCYDFVPVAPPALGRCPRPESRLAHGLQALATPMT